MSWQFSKGFKEHQSWGEGVGNEPLPQLLGAAIPKIASELSRNLPQRSQWEK